MVYGLSLFEKFNLTGWLKPYMIFSLTDETYALLTGVKEPDGINKKQFYFFIALLDQSYWVLGSVIGAVAGNMITINTKGLDFALTALFIVLMLEQIKSYKTKIPFIIGAACAIIAIFAVGKGNMLLLAIFSAITCLLLLKRRIIKDDAN
jgi:4-azaleucine resistance transporter AzlC